MTDSKPRKLTKKQAERKLAKALKQQEKGKIAYAKMDALLAEIGQRGRAGQFIDIGDGSLYQVVNQFENEDLVWAHAAARRWKIEKLSKRTSEALKAQAAKA